MDGTPDTADMRLAGREWGMQSTHLGPRLWRFQDGAWTHVADFLDDDALIGLVAMLGRYCEIVSFDGSADR